jgi:hypothetical protein
LKAQFAGAPLEQVSSPRMNSSPPSGGGFESRLHDVEAEIEKLKAELAALALRLDEITK